MSEDIQTLPQELQRYIDLELDRIQGWMSGYKVAKIARTIIDTNASSVIEIGVFAGRATIGIGLALKHVSGAVSAGADFTTTNPKTGKCISIDPWSAEASIEGWDDENRKWWNQVAYKDIFKSCQRQIKLRGIQNYIELVQSTSDDAIGDLKERGIIADVLIIDGNHSEYQSCQDVSNYLPLLRTGGSLFFDDSDWSTTQNAIDQIFDANLTAQGLTETLAHFIKEQ